MASWRDAQTAYTVKIYDKPGELGGYEWTYDRTARGNAELLAMHLFGRVVFAHNVLTWYERATEPDADGRFTWRKSNTHSPQSPMGWYINDFVHTVLRDHIDRKVASAAESERSRWEQWRLSSGNVPAIKATIANLKRLPGMVGMVAQDECRLGGWRDRRW